MTNYNEKLVEMFYKDIAKIFNVSPQIICNIKKGRNYVK